ncbi:variable large family protein [Borreliella afzelii]|uniref:variable large family protein n=1 Tax=Borreliella afzelii TaxID=29518 RepID=UPI0035948489
MGKLITAAKEVATAATGSESEAVGTVVKAAAGAGVADASSVKGIAKGIKAIVDATGGATKLTAAGEQVGVKASEAKNPIAAAIGKDDDEDAKAFDNEMKKDDQIAAAIALRGMAKDGKFAVKDAEKDAKGAVKRLVSCWGS